MWDKVISDCGRPKAAMTAQLIINLHGIGAPHSHVSVNERGYWVTRQTFISLLQMVASQPSYRLPVALTFDDGNESDVAIAAPELGKRGLKATFFIIAARIGMRHHLDRQGLSDLVSAGMEIGTHGMNHCNWRDLNETKLHAEIADSRRRIEDICGIAVRKAAVPFGAYDRRVLSQLRHESLECVYTSDGGLAQSDSWLKPRQTIIGAASEVDISCRIMNYPRLMVRLCSRARRLYKALR
jgi:peptidoglycan/xylan/chitin deacetylase (PgdA/CDA1 family)